MDPALACLAAWMPRQRWFAASAAAPQVRILADMRLASADASARVRILIVADDAPSPPAVYQVPLVERRDPDATARAGLIGVTADGVALIDGPHDPAYASALLRRAAPDVPPTPGRVIDGEQSNTSIVYRPAEGHPIICKVFRRLSEGLNPDIELQTALSRAASVHVPAFVGAVDGEWRDPVDAGRTTGGSLAFAQEFSPGVEDAWRVALRAADAGEDFSRAADELGRATAEVHLDLARLFPAPPADAARHAAITETWRRRLTIALIEVPPLLPHAAAIRERYTAASTAPWPPLQRIHGDYHLGQVLHVPGRGWVLLDFEGEPMRPMGERREPDLALRDIAGMLRSFDYVAGSLALARGAADAIGTGRAAPWATAAREAFLAGYRAVADIEPSGPLLAALELEKAVYEAIYEARHRPGWLSIPLAAIDRLIAG